ncbi:hypothetical protein ABOONEI_615 [Aciduliprofundum boonei T469]|nr:hypothetical protein ABOONEI_615 [Aciduliprofundum boonei T469]
MIISKDELFVLLNEYYLDGHAEITVSYPFYNLRLFTLNLENFKIENIIEEREFYPFKKKFTGFLRRDMPDYRDLIDSFVSSGIVDFENQGEIDENFELLKKAIADKTIYIKPIFLGIDTNIAYYRIVSRRLKDEFKYVVSQIVVDEIDDRIHTKYSWKILRALDNLPYHELVSEFANGSSKEARKAKNAMNEVNFLFDELDAFRAGESTETRDKEIRDREIALQYSHFAKEVDAEIVILTADKDMSFHAQAHGISSVYFKLPHKIYPMKIDPMRIPYLLYDLTVNFGTIKINDTIILSEWRGKDVENYLNEDLKIYNMNDKLAKDIKICRRLKDEL